MQALFNWHWLSNVVKFVMSLAALLISGILSYTFFQGISPAGMAIFPFAALSLTEGGFVAWIVIFSTMKHHKINSLIAVIMIGACLLTTLVITFAELIQLFQDHTLVSNATVQNGTLILLEVMLSLHIVAAASDFLIGKFEWLLKYANQKSGDVIEAQGYTVVEPQYPAALPKPKKGLVGVGKTLLFGDTADGVSGAALPQQSSTPVQPTMHVDQRTTQQDLQDWISVWMDSTDRQEGMPFLPWLEDLGTEHVKDATMALARRLYPVKASQQSPLSQPVLDTTHGNGHSPK
jgi:hypothetical protein